MSRTIETRRPRPVVLTEIYLDGACSCHSLLRRDDRAQVRKVQSEAAGAVGEPVPDAAAALGGEGCLVSPQLEGNLALVVTGESGER
eukprot:COSAG01_NODE_5020_length_4540_cov_25.225400_2_plen_87_part_00